MVMQETSHEEEMGKRFVLTHLNNHCHHPTFSAPEVIDVDALFEERSQLDLTQLSEAPWRREARQVVKIEEDGAPGSEERNCRALTRLARWAAPQQSLARQ